MTAEFDLMLRLLAMQRGRAQLRATHLRYALQPDALALCLLALAGEDTTVHIAACGPLDAPPELLCVADPRYRNDQCRLFDALAERLERYYRACLANGGHPQVWVASTAAAAHLDCLAERWRYVDDPPAARRFGDLLTWLAERYPIPGQQSLICATTALSAHFASGQTAAEDAHLGALLAWIDPPANSDVRAAAARAERMPMGVKTDPDFDHQVLAPLLSAFNRARRRGAPAAQLAALQQQIEAALAGVVLPIHTAVRQAAELLHQQNLPPLPDLPHLVAREAHAFAGFMRRLDAGQRLPLNDRPRAAAFRLADREDAQQNFDAALLRGDRLAFQAAVLAGHALAGIVEAPMRRQLAPRRYACQFLVASRQRTLHLREGDLLYLRADPRLCGAVSGLTRTDEVTRVAVTLRSGVRAVGMPAAGSPIELVAAVPDWQHHIRQRGQLHRRLAVTPWTHAAPPNGTAP